VVILSVILQVVINLDLKDIILNEAKNLFLSFQVKKSKRDPSDFVLKMTRKGKLTRILKRSSISA
jgi:hypothetical protein